MRGGIDGRRRGAWRIGILLALVALLFSLDAGVISTAARAAGLGLHTDTAAAGHQPAPPGSDEAGDTVPELDLAFLPSADPQSDLRFLPDPAPDLDLLSATGETQEITGATPDGQVSETSQVAEPVAPSPINAQQQLTLRTIPEIEGLIITLDEDQATTNSSGAASFTTDTVSSLSTRVDVIAPASLGDQIHVRYSRLYRIDRDEYAVALEIDTPVSFSFKGVNGETIDPGDISTMRIKNSLGAVLDDVPLDEPLWLFANRVVSTQFGPEVREIEWSIEQVIVRDSNVVNRAQLRFFPAETDYIEVETLFFSAEFKVTDMFFGHPGGNSIALTYPDGETIQHRLDDKGELRLESLPRGDYDVVVHGSGPGILRPVVISRNQVIELEFLSWLDIASVGLFVLLFLIVPFAFGRRVLKGRQAGTGAGQGSDQETEVSSDETEVDLGKSPKRAVRSAALLVLAAMLVSGSPRPAAAQAAEPGNPVVLAHYYIWFEPTSWNRAKIDYPAAGRYSSDQESVIRDHIALAQSIGIDGFIVSWKSTEVLDPRLEMLVRLAEEADFKLAITYQGLDFNRDPLPPARIADDLDLFIERYADSSAFDLFDLPLVVLSGTWEFTRDEVEQVTNGRRDRLLILATEKNVEGYERIADVVDGDLYYWSSVNPDTFPGYPDKLIRMGNAVRANGGTWIAPAAPGFNAIALGGATVVDREDGDVLTREWEGALASVPDAIGIISWNEFSENTHIEPSFEYGSRYVEVVANLTGAPRPSAVDFDSSAPEGAADRGAGGARIAGIVGFGALMAASLFVIRRRSNSEGDSTAVDPRPGPRSAPTI